MLGISPVRRGYAPRFLNPGLPPELPRGESGPSVNGAAGRHVTRRFRVAPASGSGGPFAALVRCCGESVPWFPCGKTIGIEACFPVYCVRF